MVAGGGYSRGGNEGLVLSPSPTEVKGPWPAVAQVSKFLSVYPVGHLIVVTGYVSPSGLAWLARHASSRQVSLVVGDVDRSDLRGGGPAARNTASAFLRRNDVRAFTWKYKNPGKSPDVICHAKLWAVTEGAMLAAALVGSANLTYTGMNLHFEVMAAAAESELSHLADQLAWLLINSEPANDRMIKSMGGARRA